MFQIRHGGFVVVFDFGFHAQQPRQGGNGVDFRQRDAFFDQRVRACDEHRQQAEHPCLLGGRAVHVDVVERVLLEEGVLDDVRDHQRQPLVVGQGVRSDQFRDALQGDLLLKDFHEQVAIGLPFGVLLAPPAFDLHQIFRIAVMPADGGIVAGVREAAVQRPEAADETRRVLRHGFGEVAAGRRDGPDDRHGTVRPVQIVHIAGPFVETGQTRGKIRRKSFVRRHFLQSAGQLAQGLRPTGRRIRHDGHVVAHVAVELRQRDSRVDRHFARRDRHVGRVRDQNRPFHQRPPCARIHQFRKLAEDLRHFVAAFAAADVDDDVRVAPFGQRLLRHRLARSETARNGGRAAFRDREERIDDAQTR